MESDSISAQIIAESLGQARRAGDGFLCRCPTHDDQKASLSVTDGPDKILVHCHAGCPQEEVIEDLKGLGLWPTYESDSHDLEIYHDYVDEDGQLCYQVGRKPHKQFVQRRPDGHGGWIWNLKDIPRLPYRLPELLAGIREGHSVFIVEGEKDAENLRKLGLIATTNSGGAGKWTSHLSHYLSGASEALILPDNDEPGQKHALQVASSLFKENVPVKIISLPNLPQKGDVSDWLAAGGTKEELLGLCATAPRWCRSEQPHTEKDSPAGLLQIAPLQTTTATNLMAMQFPEQRWAIEPILPEGLTIIAGSPKVGKSWLAYSLACSVAVGANALGEFTASKGKVLYLALEDNQRRLQDRLKKLSEQDHSLISGNLELCCSIPRLDEGGLDALKNWLDANMDCRLVIIDTLSRYSAEPNGKRNAYDNDYRGLAPLQKLAIEKQVAMVLITHLRKQSASDPLAAVMGSTGITGVADAIWLLKRGRAEDEGTLTVTGRDIEEQELAVKFDKETCHWRSLGDAGLHQLSIQRRKIVEVLRDSDKPLGPKEVAVALQMPETNVRTMLKKMHEQGQIDKKERGEYTVFVQHRSLRSLRSQSVQKHLPA